MSLISKLVPLILLFLGLAIAGFIGFTIYTIVTDIADKTSKQMEKKNVSFGKEGMKIGVKEVKTENYVDQTQRYENVGSHRCQAQKEGGDGSSKSMAPGAGLIWYSVLVKAWNLSTWPAYNSRFWNKGEGQTGGKKRA